MRVTQEKTKFLFVNKDSSSALLTRSEASEKADILSHVQTRRRKAAKALSQSRPWSGDALTWDAEQATAEGQSKKKNKNKSQQIVLASRRREAGAAARRPSIDHIETAIALPQMYPSGNPSDPFHCTVAGDHFRMHALLQYGVIRTARTVFLANAFAPSGVISRKRSIRHDAMIQERLEQCVSNAMLMYSTLAYSATGLGWLFGQLQEDTPAEYFIAKALPAVRARLSMPEPSADPWLLLSIYSLAITEMWQANPELWYSCPQRARRAEKMSLHTSRMHLKALISFIEAAPGYTYIDPYVLESAVLVDKYMSIADASPPLLSRESTMQHTGLYRFDYSSVHERLPTHAAAFMGIGLSDETQQIVMDIVGYAQIAHDAWRGPELDVDMEVACFWNLHEISYRLLWAKDDEVEECVRLAALLFVLNNIEYHGSCVAARSIAVRLRVAVMNAKKRWEKRSLRTLLWWILCTGAMTKGLHRDSEWFTQSAAKASDYLGFEPTREVFVEELQKFLFLPERQQPQLTRLLNAMQQRG